jgi:hypothetical protein
MRTGVAIEEGMRPPKEGFGSRAVASAHRRATEEDRLGKLGLRGL